MLFGGNIIACLAIPLFILFMNGVQIAREEEALSKIFGDEYADYKKRVRRWL